METIEIDYDPLTKYQIAGMVAVAAATVAYGLMLVRVIKKTKKLEDKLR